MRIKLHNGMKVELDNPLIRQYSQKDVADIEERLRHVSLRYHNFFPHERREVRYGHLPIKRKYDKAVVIIGRSMARQVIVEEMVRDVHQPLPTLIAALTCYDTTDREHHAKATLEQYLPGEKARKALNHAETFAYGVLVPLFRIQDPSWADALNNAGSVAFGRIGMARMYLEQLVASERRKSGHHAPHHNV